MSRLLLEGGKGHRTEDTEDTEVFGWVKIIARQGQARHPRLGRNLASTERGSGSLANYSEPHTARSSFAGLKPQSVPLSRLRHPSRFSPRHPKILRVLHSLREMPFRHSRRQSEPHRPTAKYANPWPAPHPIPPSLFHPCPGRHEDKPPQPQGNVLRAIA
jgi:hypothetical protein